MESEELGLFKRDNEQSNLRSHGNRNQKMQHRTLTQPGDDSLVDTS